MEGEFILFTVSSTQGAVGETVTVDFSVAPDSYITNGLFVVTYDPTQLELVPPNSRNYVSVNAAVLYGMNGQEADEGIVKLTYIDPYVPGTTEGGVMFSVDFKILEGCSGTVPVQLQVHELQSNSSDDINDGYYHTNCDYYIDGAIVIKGSGTTTTTVPTQPADTLTALDPATYYGRSLLAQEDEVMVEVYDFLDEQIKAFNTDITMMSYRLPLPQFERVVRYYYDDHPEVFWMSKGYSYSYYTMGDTRYIYSMQQPYGFTAAEAASYQSQLETAAATFTAGITDAMTELEREKLVHDRVIRFAEYDTTLAAANIRNVIGSMINGVCVCEGYARAFQYLMYRCGINCVLVIGQVSEGEYHMWNAVLIDGEWYQADLTWDDPTLSTPDAMHLRHQYLNVTDEQIAASRTAFLEYSQADSSYATTYPIPVCTATAAYYPGKVATHLSAFDVDAVIAAIAYGVENREYAHFLFIDGYTFADFKSDLGTNYYDVLDGVNEIVSADHTIASLRYYYFQDPITDVFGMYI